MSRADDMARLRSEIDARRGESRRDIAERRKLLAGLKQEAVERKREVSKMLHQLRKARVETTRRAMQEARKSKGAALSSVLKMKQDVARLRRENMSENEAAKRAWMRSPVPKKSRER